MTTTKEFDPKRPNAHLPPDEQVLNLVAANAARGIVPAPDIDGIPRAWLAQGYEQLAILIAQYGRDRDERKPNGDPRTITASALRNYWRIDRERGYSSLMPPPDAIIHRGIDPGELLPGWAPETILEWLPYRQGPGNHTRGDYREGNTNGRTGWRRVDGDWVKAEPEPATV